MRTSLRRSYFIRLTALILSSFMVILLLFALYEWNEYKGYPKEEIYEFLMLFSLMGLTAPFVLLAAWAIAGHLLKPIREMATTAERIRAGNLDERIPTQAYHDELARLADTINDAFDRYASAVNRLKHFSADASHQLRTPLAIIRSSADIALQQERSVEEYQEALGSILEHTERLQRIIDQLLQLSRLNRAESLPLETVQLDSLVKHWVEEISPLISEQEITLTYSAPPHPVWIQGSPLLLEEAFTNLVLNASQYTPANGHVRVTVRDGEAGWAIWSVEDSGPGIPVQDRERMLQRFQRGANAAKTGSGLGLPIVQDIVHIHKGHVHIETSQDLGGTAVLISVPIVDKAG